MSQFEITEMVGDYIDWSSRITYAQAAQDRAKATRRELKETYGVTCTSFFDNVRTGLDELINLLGEIRAAGFNVDGKVIAGYLARTQGGRLVDAITEPAPGHYPVLPQLLSRFQEDNVANLNEREQALLADMIQQTRNKSSEDITGWTNQIRQAIDDIFGEDDHAPTKRMTAFRVVDHEKLASVLSPQSP